MNGELILNMLETMYLKKTCGSKQGEYIMILRIEDLKEVCSTILTAVDASELSKLTETLEFKSANNILYLNVTNKEYYAQVKLAVNSDIDFHATVNANLFLNLISQTTTETVELKVNKSNLEVIGNGKYKLPLIYDGDKLLELPEIPVTNVTTQFDINSDILNSILKYNTKELQKGAISRPVQKLYYVDENGCITFTSGACVNTFKLASPVKLLFNSRLVKLFKLFKNESVHFKLAQEPLDENLTQTVVKFENDSIAITAILNCDATLINSVPVTAIRNRANSAYTYSVSINKQELLDCINRLLLFISFHSDKVVLKPYSKFIFTKDHVVIHDVNEVNHEDIYYNSPIVDDMEDYEALLDLTELKMTLDNYTSDYINLKFGNHQAIVIFKDTIANVVPECHSV